MGRSGTSALTRVLALCGGTLPSNMIHPNSGNPTGYWEPEAALAINDEFLHGHASSWYDPTLRIQFGDVVADAARTAYVAKIREFLLAQEQGLLVIKDPRIPAVAPYWFEAARDSGFDVNCAIPIRHPEDVSRSLSNRENVSSQLSSLLWLKYNLLSESMSRQYPRIFVPYEGLLSDWRAQVRRISAALSIDPSPADEGAIDQFLDPSLDHGYAFRGKSEGADLPMMEIILSALTSASLDREFDVLDFESAMHGYRAADELLRASADSSLPFPAGDSLVQWEDVGRHLAATYRSLQAVPQRR